MDGVDLVGVGGYWGGYEAVHIGIRILIATSAYRHQSSLQYRGHVVNHPSEDHFEVWDNDRRAGLEVVRVAEDPEVTENAVSKAKEATSDEKPSKLQLHVSKIL